jgi:hypothetical protein
MASPEPVLVDQVLQAHNSVRSKKASTDHFYLLNPNLDQQELEDYLPLGFPVLSHLSRFIDDEHQWGAYTAYIQIVWTSRFVQRNFSENDYQGFQPQL